MRKAVIELFQVPDTKPEDRDPYAVFESTLNPETRRSGGMHYTSIENIHKVIDSLFLDDLKNELKEIQQITVQRTKRPVSFWR